MRTNYFDFGPVVQISIEDISHLELWQPPFWQSKTICKILVEGIMRNVSVKLFKFGTSDSDVVYRHFSSRALATPLFGRSILAEAIMRNNSVTYFEFGQVVQEMSFRTFLI